MSEQPASPPAGGQGAEGNAPVSPPAAPPASPPSPPATPPAEPEPFYKSFKNAEIRGYTERKGWKDPESAIESFINLEKFHGVPADRLVKLPENLDDQEAVAPILAKLGYAAPKEATEYGFADMEGVDADRASALSAIALKHGVPVKTAQAVFGEVLALDKASQEALLTQATEEVSIELGQLKAEVGANNYDDYVEKARRAVRHLGFSEEELQDMETSLGAANMYRRMKGAFDKLGLGESSFVEGKKKPGEQGMSPEAARAEIAQLRNDREFGARLLNGETAAKERWTRLNLIASQDVGSTTGVP